MEPEEKTNDGRPDGLPADNAASAVSENDPQPVPGPPGPEGPEGKQGPQGPVGADGPKGAQGPQGDKGKEGEPGDNWSYLVMNGITGPQGDKGDKGDKGDQGAQGNPGDKGDKGDKGIQGDPGDKGDKGDKGDQGAQGNPGDKGDKGDKGDQGAQGSPGDKGDKGDKGDQGAQGSPGDKGDKGDKGDQGAQGSPGDKGDKGDKGDQGAQGNPGDKGDKGDKGDQGGPGNPGSPGDKGDKGDKGPEGSVPTGLMVLSPSGRAPSGYENTGVVITGNPSFKEAGNMLRPLMFLTSVVGSDGNIYAMGGQYETRSLSNVLMMLNSSTNQWEKRASMREDRYLMASCLFNNEIYTFGGVTGSSPNQTVERYIIGSDVWQQRAAMPKGAPMPVAVTYKDKIYVFSQGDQDSLYLQVYQPGIDRWIASSDISLPNCSFGRGVVVGSKVYLFGAYSEKFQRRINLYFDLETGKSGELSLPAADSPINPAVALLNGKIYVIGGRDLNVKPLNLIYCLDPSTDTWFGQPAILANAGVGMAASAINGRIYTFGGGPTGSGPATDKTQYTYNYHLQVLIKL